MQLTDLLTSPSNRHAIQRMSHQFGLSQDQTVAAIEALMPAFSLGLKRNVSSAGGAASLIEALATGEHGRYVDEPDTALTDEGIDDGNAILGHLFGNKQVSRAVAARASSATGIGSSILKKMLPVVASIVMGALFKGATGRRSGSGGLGEMLGQAAGGGILGSLIEGLAGGALKGARSQRRRRSRGRSGGSLEDLLGGILGGRRPTRRSRRQRSKPVMPPSQSGESAHHGDGSIFDELLGQSAPRRQRRGNRSVPPTRQRRVERRPRQGGGLNDIFGEMLEPGGNTSPEYQRETGSVFDELLGRSRHR